jgi:hypothetical protein
MYPRPQLIALLLLASCLGCGSGRSFDERPSSSTEVRIAGVVCSGPDLGFYSSSRADGVPRDCVPVPNATVSLVKSDTPREVARADSSGRFAFVVTTSDFDSASLQFESAMTLGFALPVDPVLLTRHPDSWTDIVVTLPAATECPRPPRGETGDSH